MVRGTPDLSATGGGGGRVYSAGRADGCSVVSWSRCCFRVWGLGTGGMDRYSGLHITPKHIIGSVFFSIPEFLTAH